MAGQKQIMIFTVCPSCHAAYKVPDIVLGKVVTCKRCSSTFNVEKFIPEKKCPPLAKIAVEKQLLTDKAVVEAIATLRARKKAGESARFEDILLEKKMISKELLDNLVVAVTRQQDKEFGIFAINQNLVAEKDIREALDIQAQHFKKNKSIIPISKILTQKGICTKEACEAILKQQERFSEDSCFNETVSENPLANRVSAEKGISKDKAGLNNESDIAAVESQVQKYQNKKFFEIRQLDKEFLQLSIDNHFITKEEGDNIFSKQLLLFEKTKQLRFVGDILVAFNLLDREKCDSLLVKQQRLDEKDVRFCNLAVEKGFISNEISEKIKTRLRDRRGGPEERLSAKQLCISEKYLTPDQCTEIYKISVSEQQDKAAEGYMVKEKFTIKGNNFQLLVSKDGLRAFLIREKDLPEYITISDIKNALGEKGIFYGILDDSLIEGFLRYEGYKNKKFKIAEGKSAKKGRNAVIKYYFELDHRRVGALQQGGKIDFKDRGEIPHVSKGDLIAEKIPLIQNEEGIDVFSQPIPIDQISDTPFLSGAGVEMSDDGLKIYAAVDGQPDASLGGKVSVLQEFHIPGNVGFETGHVEFDGNVNVSGVIQDGFRVRAAALKVKEILGGDIHTTGDIEVKGGVTNAVIRSLGDVKGKYFSNVTINSLGDVVVQKEIIDSKINAGGFVIIKGGKILSSEIAAKKGIESNQIGTDISVPCKLKIGVDAFSENELERLNNRISELTEQKDALLKEIEASKEAEGKLHMDIANLAQVQDRAMVEQRSLEKKLAELKQEGDKNTIAEIEARIKDLEQKARSADDEISVLFEEQDKLVETQADLVNNVKKNDELVQEINEEKKAFILMLKEKTKDAYVKVSDIIYEGTSVTGPHSKLILKKSLKNGKIKEMMMDSAGEDSDWQMKIIK